MRIALLALAALATSCASSDAERANPIDPSAFVGVDDGWFGYPFEFERVAALAAGVTVDEATRALRGDPVARDVHEDGTTSYLWYHERREDVRAVELEFQGGRFVRVGERVHRVGAAIDHGAVPIALAPRRWTSFPEVAPDPEDALLLRPRGRVMAGSAYDHHAFGALGSAPATLEEVERALRGSPAWIAEFADGRVRAAWFQLTPTRGTYTALDFGPDGRLRGVRSREAHVAYPIEPPAVGSQDADGAAVVRVIELWKIPR